MEHNLIKSVAAKFYHQQPYIWERFEDLMSEATLAYLESQATYKPGTTKETTWAYIYMRNRLIDIIKHIPPISSQEPYEQAVDYLDPFERVSLAETLDGLSEDSKHVLRIVAECPAIYFRACPRKPLKDKLRAKGWSWPRIWRSLREIKNALNET
jgi:DNA-directed RNA polymerase specialized sigma24 family protein